jgi:uncharacterized protein
MCTTRRHFLNTAALGGVSLAIAPVFICNRTWAGASSSAPDSYTGERISPSPGSFYRVYAARLSGLPESSTWVQIDLGSSQPIESVRLYPSNGLFSPGNGFPLLFRIESSEDAGFDRRQLIADRTRVDYEDPGDRVVQLKALKATGRYVRLTVTRLRQRKMPAFMSAMPEAIQQEIRDELQSSYFFGLSKIEVLSKGTDIAVHRSVIVDLANGRPEDAQQLTRAPRPQGEGIVTDNVQNVTAPETWRPVMYRAKPPLSRVELRDGIFLTAMRANVDYLLESFSVDDLLHQFRERAGKPVPPSVRTPEPFWEEDLGGSNAGRFLMGAGNTLRWIDDPRLRARMNDVVAGIAECRQPNGYIMGYPEDTFFVSERGAYTRSWTTQGLIEAGYAGNGQAFEMLRGYYDWYNQRSYLPQALRGCTQGAQGMVANTRMYFTPVGKATDIHVIQRYFQENYWLEDLAAHRVDAIWQYPYDRPHCYLLTNLEAYLDLYCATGEPRYLDAVRGAWDLFRENWQNVGGSISIIELQDCPPRSNSLYAKLGENCGSAFWILLNHRLHMLYPDEEKYVTEIEKSIYNVMLANQGGSHGIRYHTMLVGQKEHPTRINTCCEGQGTRLIGSLPQYIYSTADDGIYVNIFEPSTITWSQANATIRLEMQTSFPLSPDVRLNVHPSVALQTKVRIRVPSWASGVMKIEVNGVYAMSGMPGSYVVLERLWSQGDTISFRLPIAFKLTRYAGVDQIKGQERFSLEYGPILMAALGAADAELTLIGAESPLDLAKELRPVKDQPLHFTMYSFALGAPGGETVFVPYFEIGSESFSCVPVIRTTPVPL